MKIAYVPGRELSYSRTRMFIRGLQQNHADVRVYGSASKSFVKRALVVPLKFLFRKQRDEDVVLIGFFGQHLAIFLKPFIRNRIVFDAFLSAYDTLVFDRKKFKKGSWAAGLCFWLDKKSCQLADKVLLDTNQHIEYFVRTFGLPREKFARVLIGADDGLFYPRRNGKKKGEKLLIGFHGLFIPLQGVEYIVKAAKLLEKEILEFQLVGNGQTFEACVKLAESLQLKNVQFLGLKKPEEIPDCIASWDIGLGIFGETEKTQRVIPNKAYEIIAMKKPLITADTPAIRELFMHKKDVFLCKAKDEHSLAEAILALKKDEKLREKIAEGGYALYKKDFTPKKIGEEILNACV